MPPLFVERELKQGRSTRHKAAFMEPPWHVVSCCCCRFSGQSPTTVQNLKAEKQAWTKVGWSTSSADVFLRLEEDECHYYINRGLEMGIDTIRWSQLLTGREITLEVVDRPAGLNWFGRVGPVRGVMFQGDTLYRTGVVRNP